MDLSEHSLPSQQHIQVVALIQHLAHGSNGAVQLGQTLVEFLYLQVQRLGLHLTNLLDLKEQSVWVIRKIATSNVYSHSRVSSSTRLSTWETHFVDTQL